MSNSDSPNGSDSPELKVKSTLAPTSKPDAFTMSKEQIAEEIAKTELRLSLRQDLPHLYGFKHYLWSREFYESKNHICLLTAANQIGKSTAQIRKCINWATDQDLWRELWATTPNLFWYLYPSQAVVNAEFETKWKQYLPKGVYKTDDYYGWEEIKKGKDTIGIKFNSGVTLSFKTYEQNVHVLQSSTVYALFCFSANTPVKTDSGYKEIKDITTDDKVFTCKGSSSVLNTVSRESSTIMRVTNTGLIVEATPDHYFKTKDGEWLQFQKLSESNVLESLEMYEKEFDISDIIIQDIQRQKTGVCTISEMAQLILLMDSCTEQSINTILEKYQKDLSFTTKMKMLQIIALIIWSLCQNQSIQGITKLKSGRLTEILTKIKNLHAKYVTQNLNLEPAKEESQDHVLGLAEDFLMEKELIAIAAEKAISKEKIEEISKGIFVLKGATEEQKNKVYCLKTETGSFQLYDITTKNCDEELPVSLFNELMFRISATDGYFSMAFTATRGQDEWRRAMEPQENEEEWLPTAFKQTVSMYDSMVYEDGSPSPWTLARIKEKEARCSTKNEVLKRIHGKFILDTGGRKYESFDPKRHYKEPHVGHICPKGWLVFCGVDIGSGGVSGHPSAIVYVAVKPDMTEGRVIAGWRGDGIITTAGDVVEKYIELNKYYRLQPIRAFYDWASKDFYNIAVSMGLSFEKADKSHDRGEEIVNTLFKNDLLYIYRTEELLKLGKELAVLKKDEDKKKAKDDIADAMRYAITGIPWNFSNLAKQYEDAPIDENAGLTEEQIAHKNDQEARRRRSFQEENGFFEDTDSTDAEFEDLNEQYG